MYYSEEVLLSQLIECIPNINGNTFMSIFRIIIILSTNK